MSIPPESSDAALNRLRWNMERIEGYLQIGMLDKARSLMDNLPDWAEEAVGTDMLILQLDLASRGEDWVTAAQLSETLNSLLPENPNGIIQWAYATRRTAGITQAKAILEKGLRDFPSIAIIHYNLGCYACAQNDLETARAHLATAFELDEAYIEVGLDDEDLVALRAFIEDMQSD